MRGGGEGHSPMSLRARGGSDLLHARRRGRGVVREREAEREAGRRGKPERRGAGAVGSEETAKRDERERESKRGLPLCKRAARCSAATMRRGKKWENMKLRARVAERERER